MGSNEDGYVVLDPERVDALRIERKLSRKELATRAGVAPHTGYRFCRGQRVQMKSVRKLFKSLGINDFRSYVARDQSGDGDLSDALDARVLGEWRVENTLTSTPITLSNGLEFRICRLAHTELRDTYGRGKCYDLQHLRSRDSRRVKEQLSRHPIVCRSVGPHPRFPVNERVLFSNDRSRFWVIDSWFDGITLHDKLRYGPLPASLLRSVAMQILEGLGHLHEHGIIRRELSPRFVVLTEPDSSVLLTELELAKLLEGGTTVSETWDADPYRAPEIEADEIDFRVDLYSWAQILVHAATGKTPPTPADPELLDKVSLPRAIKNIARRCLSVSHTWRPESVQHVRRVVAEWH